MHAEFGDIGCIPLSQCFCADHVLGYDIWPLAWREMDCDLQICKGIDPAAVDAFHRGHIINCGDLNYNGETK